MIGRTFTDMFGTYTVTSEARWSPKLGADVVDVRTPEGWVIVMAVEAVEAQS